MNCIFFGTPELSSYVLEELYIKGFDVKAVVTQPDKKTGRGLKLNPTPVKIKALELGLNVFQPESFNKTFFHELKQLGDIDLCVVVAYGMYIPSYFIEYMGSRILNIHFSLLPKYRGSAPVARAIMNGEKQSGVSIMEITKQMDEGDVVAQEALDITNEHNTETLSFELVKLGTSLLLDTVPLYMTGKVKKIKQKEMNIEPSYASKIMAEEKIIDWNDNAVNIHNKIRALYPWPVAETVLEDTVIKLIKTSFLERNVNAEPGTITGIDKVKGNFAVQTGAGTLLVEKLKPSGKKEMDVKDFINGYDLKKGTRFKYV